MTAPLLRFKVVKHFPGFSLECEGAFEPGVTAIFGPSGSGKTTLLNCIAGLVSPDSAEIEVAGRTVFSTAGRVNMPPERRRFGYVFQDGALFPHMSVADNVRYGFKLTPPTDRSVDVDHLIDLFGLGRLLDRSVTTLSGGELQRVALARALATSPRLLLLDEPLASLDGGFRGVIIEHLRRVRRELDTPMIYVSHSMSEVTALADETLVLAEGRQVVYGRTSQVMVHPQVYGLADYATLENLMEAEVLTNRNGDGLAELRIGEARVLAPEVHRRPGDVITVSIRAGDVILTLDVPGRISARNVIEAGIEQIHDVGSRVLVYTDMGARLIVEITPGALRDLDLREGQRVYLIIKTNSVIPLDVPA